jgi:epoxyqueuosine reductase
MHRPHSKPHQPRGRSPPAYRVSLSGESKRNFRRVDFTSEGIPVPEIDPVTLKANVRLIARALGFADCRVAAIGPPTHGAEFERWIAEGRHGDMEWMARGVERRLEPGRILPGARSMIVVALDYFPGESGRGKAAASGKAHGVFARYAWGDDYHDVMTAKLRDLAAHLDEHGGRQRIYVDTGPVLERDFATDAGLGWSGKSTMQIHPRLGTWFFLGEILTTLGLPPDPPLPDRCGRCTRCIDVCPTRAITAPHSLDARRCISYLTIEHKGPIPAEFRRLIGTRIFGCDDCLEVCPWNRFAESSREAAFAARDFVTDWRLRDFLGLDDAGFRRLFRNSPVKRIKRPAFLRNVCIALGNAGTADDLPALRAAADDPDPLIAEHAHWAIAEIGRRTGGERGGLCG